MSTLRFRSQQHHEPVIAVKKLADFKQVTPEQTYNGAVGVFPQSPRTFRKRTVVYWTGRTGNSRPHRFCKGLTNCFRLVAPVKKRKISLLKIQRSVRHLGEDSAALRTNHPASLVPFKPRPGRYKTLCTIRQCPWRPGFIV